MGIDIIRLSDWVIDMHDRSIQAHLNTLKEVQFANIQNGYTSRIGSKFDESFDKLVEFIGCNGRMYMTDREIFNACSNILNELFPANISKYIERYINNGDYCFIPECSWCLYFGNGSNIKGMRVFKACGCIDDPKKVGELKYVLDNCDEYRVKNTGANLFVDSDGNAYFVKDCKFYSIPRR